MAISDLTLFFKNINKLTSFERKKKIYDLTNDLDINLIHDLSVEIKLYYLNKIRKRHRSNIEKIRRETGGGLDLTNPQSYFNLDAEVNRIIQETLSTNSLKKSFNYYLDYLIDYCGEDVIGEIIEESSQFLFELNELENRAKKLSKNIEYSKIKSVGKTTTNIEESIDYSDTNITEKIISLKLLGVIDFLHSRTPFNTSVNKLASALSIATGSNSKTLQSMLNRMLNTKIEDDKRNPMNSENTVSVVINKLINIGYNPK
jgi:hypothetical protein